MKRVLLSSVVVVMVMILVFAGLSAAKEWKKVRVATEGAYPPWNATDPAGKLYGFDLDVIDEVCKRSGLDCEISAHAWKGIIPGLTAGKYDCIIAGMQTTHKRLKVIDFAGPYAKTPGSFATIKSSPLANYKSSPDRVTLNEISTEECPNQVTRTSSVFR